MTVQGGGTLQKCACFDVGQIHGHLKLTGHLPRYLPRYPATHPTTYSRYICTCCRSVYPPWQSKAQVPHVLHGSLGRLAGRHDRTGRRSIHFIRIPRFQGCYRTSDRAPRYAWAALDTSNTPPLVSSGRHERLTGSHHRPLEIQEPSGGEGARVWPRAVGPPDCSAVVQCALHVGISKASPNSPPSK